MNLLNKDPKSSVYPLNRTSTLKAAVVSDLASGICFNTRLNTDEIRQLINENDNFPKRIKKKIAQKNLMFVKADSKSNALITMTSANYKQKYFDFLIIQTLKKHHLISQNTMIARPSLIQNTPFHWKISKTH